MESASGTSPQFNVDLTLRLGVSTNEENVISNDKASQNAASSGATHAHAQAVHEPPSSIIAFRQGVLPRRASPARRRHNADAEKICRGCGVVNTPLWRKGPDGPQTLCNACGLRHSRTAKRNNE